MGIVKSKNRHGGFDFYQNRRQATVFCLGAQVLSRCNNGFFIFRCRPFYWLLVIQTWRMLGIYNNHPRQKTV